MPIPSSVKSGCAALKSGALAVASAPGRAMQACKRALARRAHPPVVLPAVNAAEAAGLEPDRFTVGEPIRRRSNSSSEDGALMTLFHLCTTQVGPREFVWHDDAPVAHIDFDLACARKQAEEDILEAQNYVPDGFKLTQAEIAQMPDDQLSNLKSKAYFDWLAMEGHPCVAPQPEDVLDPIDARPPCRPDLLPSSAE
jgi:hypothetical protein